MSAPDQDQAPLKMLESTREALLAEAIGVTYQLHKDVQELPQAFAAAIHKIAAAEKAALSEHKDGLRKSLNVDAKAALAAYIRETKDYIEQQIEGAVKKTLEAAHDESWRRMRIYLAGSLLINIVAIGLLIVVVSKLH